ncbi:MAG: hypothetical protein JXQ76_12480 [Campylobacterales bacterium]|nr:hypothetical protein [Campylobacterales bacterium]
MKLFLLFSHILTPLQVEDAKASLGVDRFVYLPDDIQALWSQIPADIADINPYLDPIKEYLQNNTTQGDYVLIQGDFGATYTMVNFAEAIGIVPIYSTNSRKSVEKEVNGEVIKQSIFVHQLYRNY